MLLRALDDVDAAVAQFEAVARLLPDDDTARLNLAAALDEAGDHARALGLIDASPALLAAAPAARWHAAAPLLHAGDYARGLAFFESRWAVGDPALRMRSYAQPLWDGAARAGRLLVWHEQGLGDSLLGMRFAAAAAARGLTVIAEVQPPLRALMAGMRGVAEVADPLAPPPFDLHLPALSLPHALGVRPGDAGRDLPALVAPPQRAEKWAALLPPADHFRIGLAWRSTVYRETPEALRSKLGRSLPLASLLPFGALRGVELVSLQVAEGAEETASTPGLTLTDLTAHIDDLADTAALIARLDLVVSIDTVIAHVAGCLGAPLFVLAPQVPDWRWHAMGTASPWYPAARVFRQARRNDWRAPVASACAAARELVAARRPRGWLARATQWATGR